MSRRSKLRMKTVAAQVHHAVVSQAMLPTISAPMPKAVTLMMVPSTPAPDPLEKITPSVEAFASRTVLGVVKYTQLGDFLVEWLKDKNNVLLKDDVMALKFSWTRALPFEIRVSHMRQVRALRKLPDPVGHLTRIRAKRDPDAERPLTAGQLKALREELSVLRDMNHDATSLYKAASDALLAMQIKNDEMRWQITRLFMKMPVAENAGIFSTTESPQ